MNLKPIFIVLVLLISFSALSAQETGSGDYVDVKQTNEEIALLERENEINTEKIAANNERKSFLENRIQSAESRLATVEENLAYSQETIQELNALNRETRDKETKAQLESSRSELRNIIWLLTNEQTSLTIQRDEDTDEVEFLTGDTGRRETVIEENNILIEEKKQAVSTTESKINEISTKLESIISRIDGFRSEAGAATAP